MRTGAALALLGIFAATLAPRPAQASPSQSYLRAHELHSLDSRVAETLGWEICRSVGSTADVPCKVTEATDHKLVVLGPDEAHARIVKMLSERDPPGKPAQRFEVTLVGVVEGRPRGDLLPEAPTHVRNALQGLAELMQGVRFDILATGWVKTSDTGEIRLADADGNAYRVELRYRGRRTGLERTELQVDVKATNATNNPNLRDLLETSLSLFAGETVVVGSSTPRTRNTPLILLLRAP